jgi:hypothetical protein
MDLKTCPFSETLAMNAFAQLLVSGKTATDACEKADRGA